jgi:bifunctional ADP-heptose synthase (sugar kinase/adenylyltransferase)
MPRTQSRKSLTAYLTPSGGASFFRILRPPKATCSGNLTLTDSTRIQRSVLKGIKNNHYLGVSYDAIIISDYCKGFLTEEDIDEISEHNFNIFLDTKKILGDWCKNVSYIKINHVEFDRTKHTINEMNINDQMIITRSNEGCEYQNILYPVDEVNIKDISGAGDTFISGLVCEYVRSNDILKAIKFAQECATIVVQKKGVCTI